MIEGEVDGRKDGRGSGRMGRRKGEWKKRDMEAKKTREHDTSMSQALMVKVCSNSMMHREAVPWAQPRSQEIRLLPSLQVALTL